MIMRKMLVIFAGSATLFSLYSCRGGGNGQLVGVQNRPKWYQADPYGMVYIGSGSYNMGDSDQDVPANFVSPSKTVTVEAFYMDQTEISNNEYRQFVHHVRDSLALTLLGEDDEDTYLITTNQYDEDLDPPLLNWNAKIRWEKPEVRELLEDLYYPEAQRYFRQRTLNTDKLIFTYWWVDYKEASKQQFIEPRVKGLGPGYDERGGANGYLDRRQFYHKEDVKIYPDTLVWVRDFDYSYNEPHTKMYFWHPAYDNYPVVGINWHQANAFCHWRSWLMNNFLMGNGDFPVNDFRLPTEAEWEYAARGGLDLAAYPWGSYYIRNSKGCFLGNFKPMRGNYIDDGGAKTVAIDTYNPNNYGLYQMAGNVAEWTSVAYEDAAYMYMHDLNPDLQYRAKESDNKNLKRKVIRGGSWKDVGFYLQVSARAYEYQDTSKSYIGFRCVQSFLGRDKADY